MKLVNRIFVVFGALSVFSLFQFDAMASAYDGSADCSSAPTAGYYCKKAGSKPACPVGCYCPGGVKTAVGGNSDDRGMVTSACEGKWSHVEGYLNERGIFYCPDDFPTTATSTTISRGQCKTKGSPLIYLESGAADCTEEVAEGKYCKTAGHKYDCKSGCYCTGGSKEAVGVDIDEEKACSPGNMFYPSRLNPAHVYKCPEEYPYSDSGASEITNCYRKVDGSIEYYQIPSKTIRMRGTMKIEYKCEASENNVGTPEEVLYGAGPVTKVTVWEETVCNAPLGKKFAKWDCNGTTVEPGSTLEIKLWPDGGMITCIAQWKCGPGFYPVMSASPRSDLMCKICEAGFYCQDGVRSQCSGDTYTDSTGQTSCTPCSSGQVANENHTGCVTSGNEGGDEGNGGTSAGEQGCEKGQYYDGTECVGCETGYFCPGDGEKYECPEGTSPNDNGNTCQASVSKTEMTNCWKYYEDPSAFRECVYGVDVDKWK